MLGVPTCTVSVFVCVSAPGVYTWVYGPAPDVLTAPISVRSNRPELIGENSCDTVPFTRWPPVNQRPWWRRPALMPFDGMRSTSSLSEDFTCSSARVGAVNVPDGLSRA